jgi:hypothetical protein
MSVKSQITTKLREMFNIRIRRSSSLWPKISSLCDVYGEEAVIDAFEEWSMTKVGIIFFTADNIDDFIRDADGLLKQEVVLTPSPHANKVVAEIASISQDTVIFDKKQSLMITSWLERYMCSIDEIVTAFRTFYEQIKGDDRRIKLAARDFCQTTRNFCPKGVELIQLARYREKEKMRERQRQEQIVMPKPL